MSDGERNLDATAEDMIQIERALRRFGPGSQDARDANRRYAAGLHDGEIVVFDHHFTPAKHMSLPESVRNRHDAEFIANFLNCDLEVHRGMEVAGLGNLILIALGDARISVRLAILNYLAHGQFGEDKPFPGFRIAI